MRKAQSWLRSLYLYTKDLLFLYVAKLYVPDTKGTEGEVMSEKKSLALFFLDC